MLIFALLAALGTTQTSAAPSVLSEQQYLTTPACELLNGQAIAPCSVGYRTAGVLAADKSNVVVLLTWFTGQSQDWEGYLGPDRMLDVADTFFIVIDALGGGVSSSPSTRGKHERASDFPQATIADMVESQHRVLSEQFGISHVRAIVGVSMGGMQALEWSTRYPDFMDAVVSIVGTPRALPEDMKPWRSEVRYAMPTHRMNRHDRRYQLRAMVAHDVAPGLDYGAMAELIHARTLFVVSMRDTLLHPEPSLALANAMGADVFTVEGRCGHLAPMVCERARVEPVVRDFLNSKAQAWQQER